MTGQTLDLVRPKPIHPGGIASVGPGLRTDRRTRPLAARPSHVGRRLLFSSLASPRAPIRCDHSPLTWECRLPNGPGRRTAYRHALPPRRLLLGTGCLYVSRARAPPLPPVPTECGFSVKASESAVCLLVSYISLSGFLRSPGRAPPGCQNTGGPVVPGLRKRDQVVFRATAAGECPSAVLRARPGRSSACCRSSRCYSRGCWQRRACCAAT